MLNRLSVKQVKNGLKEKRFSSLEVTKACLDAIRKTDEKLHSFVTVSEEEALRDAKNADEKISKGEDAPLQGIPLAIKDNFLTKDIRTTASSKILDEFMPTYDATVVLKLKDAGMVILGKTNMDAWAHGSSTETSDYGATRNPWDISKLPGGSSGGSAAAVAAHQTIAAIGSETAGSIRQPASWCGVVGLKPTYGRVSRYGIVAMGSSLDSAGPITKTVEDSALILSVLAGKDPKDATTSPLKLKLKIESDIKGLRIGVSPQYFINGIDPEVESGVKNAVKTFKELGAEIKELELFDPNYAIDVYTIIQRSEVSSNLARYDGIRFGKDRSYFGEEAKRRIMLGTYALSSGYYDQYYNKAQKVRAIIIEDFRKAFEKVDVIIAPTSPSLPLPVGSTKDSSMFGELADVLVEPSSIAGLSGINIPVGFSSSGLPIGAQIIGPQFQENAILGFAKSFEENTQNAAWRKNEPSFTEVSKGKPNL
ncbi:MAG: Glutamyl-tRNA(Gln) amidotransferase subunit A [Candidatus Levybacteria bacterium GW2011_GWC2_40_7]|nr:MAG: Glutamyl-tRNA(Gln) amidotransferase subunit A [Candidatus Levybacteria bacterium GW2011_GWC2_40_7]